MNPRSRFAHGSASTGRNPGCRARLSSLVALLVAVACLGSGPHAARASMVLALDLPDLVRQSEHIAVVDVVSITTAWDQAHQRIYSTIDLQVVESWKAPASASAGAGAHLTVVQPGGTVGDITMTVTGLGSFLAGERSVVFLRGPASHAQLVGMTQGKRPLRFHSPSQRWMVAPPSLRQVELVRPASPVVSTPATPVSPAARAPSGTKVPAQMALDDFRAEVKRLLASTAPASVP